MVFKIHRTLAHDPAILQVSKREDDPHRRRQEQLAQASCQWYIRNQIKVNITNTNSPCRWTRLKTILCKQSIQQAPPVSQSNFLAKKVRGKSTVQGRTQGKTRSEIRATCELSSKHLLRAQLNSPITMGSSTWESRIQVSTMDSSPSLPVIK